VAKQEQDSPQQKESARLYMKGLGTNDAFASNGRRVALGGVRNREANSKKVAARVATDALLRTPCENAKQGVLSTSQR
jgi:hypothetical protein